MPAFNEMSFAQRWKQMGDQAEHAFEEVYEAWGLKYQRFGWDRTEVSLRGVPDKLKNVPDFFTNKGLVECMGIGRDQTWKLKTHKADALWAWHRDFRTDIFLWDSHHQEWAFVRMTDLICILDNYEDEGIALETFHDGPSYYAIVKALIPVTEAGWRKLPSSGLWAPARDDR